MRHFLALMDFTQKAIQDTLDLPRRLRGERRCGGYAPVLQGEVLAMVFQKPSLHTRVASDKAMRHLGGDALYLSPSEIGLGQRESIANVSRVVSSYVEAIMARVCSHQQFLELARYASGPVINRLSGFNHNTRRWPTCSRSWRPSARSRAST